MASASASGLLHTVDVDTLAPAMGVMFEELAAFHAEVIQVLTGRVEPVTTHFAAAGIEGWVLVNVAATISETTVYSIWGSDLPLAPSTIMSPNEVIRLVPEAISVVHVIPWESEAGYPGSPVAWAVKRLRHDVPW